MRIVWKEAITWPPLKINAGTMSTVGFCSNLNFRLNGLCVSAHAQCFYVSSLAGFFVFVSQRFATFYVIVVYIKSTMNVIFLQ